MSRRPRLRLVAGASFAVVLSLAPVRAEAAGCAVTATGHPTMRGNCRYIATGPSSFTVRTLSGYRIMVSDDDGVSWRTLSAKTAVPNRPETGVAAIDGIVNTKPGQLVDISIGVSWITTMNGDLRYTDGTISAQSS